jgi:hypothetical protein
MTLKRFQDLLVEFGPEIGAWPECERATVRRMLILSDEAVLSRHQTAQLEAALMQPPPVVSPAAVERVLEKLAQRMAR